MAILGEQSTDSQRTLTLRQWSKANPDLAALAGSLVKMVFKPSKFGSFGFITEHEFKVVVERSTPLANFLEANLEQTIQGNACLWIRIKDASKGSWALESIDSSQTIWEETSWGFKAVETKAKKPDSGKSSRAK